MATLIDLGSGRYVAGEPVQTLAVEEHWCDYCAGTGLVHGYSFNDEYELDICQTCDGRGATDCDGAECLSCVEAARTKRSDRLYTLMRLIDAAIDRADHREEWSESSRLITRRSIVSNAWCATLRA